MTAHQHTATTTDGSVRLPAHRRIVALVVVAGILASVAIPRVLAARAEWTDAAAMAELDRATRLIAAYYEAHGAFPESPADVGFEPAAGVAVSEWEVQTVNGRESVHLHLSHGPSKRLYHVHFPAEATIAVMPWVVER